MRNFTAALGIAFASLFSISALACGPDALGTSRVMEVDTSKYREIQGHERSFGLKHKEVILTFDDGPIAGKTPRVLQALKKECVKATFFYVGRMAKVYPRLVRRVVREGHTLAHHTHAHNRLPNYPQKYVSAHIDRGISTLQKIAYSKPSALPSVPFFRYPYLARNKRTDKVLAQKGLIAFGANIDSLDWKKDSPTVVHNRIMRLLRREGKGIILMHDIQNRTAKMLPRLLRSLKKEGYRVVHIVPKPNKGGPRPIPAYDKDPVVVASLSPNKTQSAKQHARVARLTKEAERDVKQALLKAGVEVEVRTAPKAKILESSARTPVAVAAARERQFTSSSSNPKVKPLQVDEVKTASLKPRPKKVSKKRSSLRVVAGETSTKSKKKRTKTAKRKTRKKIRLARNLVRSKTWKLRRSQWIIN